MEDKSRDPISEFKLTPEHFQEARERVQKQMTEEAKQKKRQTTGDRVDAMCEAVGELKALANSPARRDILYRITLARNDKLGMTLELLPGLGLCQTIATKDLIEPEPSLLDPATIYTDDIAIEPINEWPGDDLAEVVYRFSLSAEQLRSIREKIEAE